MSAPTHAFGGRFVAEVIWGRFERVAEVYAGASADSEFRALRDRWMSRVGRPTALVPLERISGKVGGANIWAKRDDLGGGSGYTALSAAGQALLAAWGGYRGVFCESVTGDFAVALCSAANALGLTCDVVMGRADLDEEPLNAHLLREMGARVHAVDTWQRGRFAAWSRAMRFWAEHDDLMYCASALAAPAPFPSIVEQFNAVIGAELSVQADRKGVRPDYIVAPVGSGAYAMGLFSAYLQGEVQLVGVQAFDPRIPGVLGTPGIMYGAKTSVLQDAEGLPLYRESAAGGLAHNAVGPQLASAVERGRVMLTSVAEELALEAAASLLHHEGVAVALEAAHAVAYALQVAKTLDEGAHVVVGLTGNATRRVVASMQESR